MTTLAALSLVAGLAAAATAGDFPYRTEYADCPTIETTELATRLEAGEILVVDVRSGIEFDVIHVVGAHHVPVSKKTFAAQVQELAAAHPGKSMAFYCNGVTCLKSYKATRAALAAGLTDVYAFDAGIPAWTQEFPEHTLLLGDVVTDPEQQVIPKARFKERCLPWSEFQTQASAGAQVIDVREPVQRGDKLPGLAKPLAIPLDVFLPNFVAKGESRDETILIYDQVGKQVRWLMYYLEKQGYEDYWFLDGGVLGVLKEQNYRS
jgi:rhodanese-related sulfurtransferase